MHARLNAYNIIQENIQHEQSAIYVHTETMMHYIMPPVFITTSVYYQSSLTEKTNVFLRYCKDQTSEIRIKRIKVVVRIKVVGSKN